MSSSAHSLSPQRELPPRFPTHRARGAGPRRFHSGPPRAAARLSVLRAAMTYDGIVPHAEGATSGGLYFTDPDGLRLEIDAASGIEGCAPVEGAPTCGFF
jgi:hypothetical protein